MTWKPTDEMLKVFDMAADPLGFGDNNLEAALIAVQPLIAAEARAKALGEANEAVYQALKYGNPWPAVKAIEVLQTRSDDTPPIIHPRHD